MGGGEHVVMMMGRRTARTDAPPTATRAGCAVSYRADVKTGGHPVHPAHRGHPVHLAHPVHRAHQAHEAVWAQLA